MRHPDSATGPMWHTRRHHWLWRGVRVLLTSTCLSVTRANYLTALCFIYKMKTSGGASYYYLSRAIWGGIWPPVGFQVVIIPFVPLAQGGSYYLQSPPWYLGVLFLPFQLHSEQFYTEITVLCSNDWVILSSE